MLEEGPYLVLEGWVLKLQVHHESWMALGKLVNQTEPQLPPVYKGTCENHDREWLCGCKAT